jgi:phosphoribosyl-ATP pyrophosphohydrolase
LTNETADLIYHLFVLLAHRDIALTEIEQELARRFGISGLAEKAARKETSD